jgi:hypothetical protein
MSIADRLRVFLLVAVGYGLFYAGNNYLTEFLHLEPAAHIIHLPSGVRMLLVMVTGVVGACAVAAATFPYSYFVLFSENHVLAVVISITTGLIPLATFLLLRPFLNLQKKFSNLTVQKLALISVTYAAINTITQQLIIQAFMQTTTLLNAMLVMFTGDILGIVIVLYILRMVGKVLRQRQIIE